MAIDGLLLHKISKELNQFTPCKINKIQNVSDEEILLHLHTRHNGTKKLVINVHSNTNRIYFTQQKETTQSNPSNFVMVLRKQCNNCILTQIEQKNFDRILDLHLSCRNELGDFVEFDLYVELMGKYANMVLVNKDEIIIDALKRIPVYENSKRFIHPGAKYQLPEQKEKKLPNKINQIDPDQSLVQQVYGFSPLLANEFEYRFKRGESYLDVMNELNESNMLYIYKKEYHCIALTHLNQDAKIYPLMEGLDSLYIENEHKIRIKEQCGDVYRCVDKELKKAKKKLPKLEASLEQSNDYKKYQEYGDLLFAYMFQIKKEPTVTLTSFETNEEIRIPLDMRLDLKGNANKYYQKYHKLKRSKDVLKEQIKLCKEEIAYYAQLHQQLENASIEDALEIREELVNNHVLFEKKNKRANKKKKVPNFIHLQLEDADIYIGKNNLQNNYITHKLSRKNDLWFHVKDYHGSHVLLKTNEVNEKYIRMCAQLAAYYSKGQQSSSVPVDYCPIHQLKKVPGSKIGFVTMKSYKTIYIDPETSTIQNYLKRYKKR